MTTFVKKEMTLYIFYELFKKPDNWKDIYIYYTGFTFFPAALTFSLFVNSTH